MFSLQKLFGKDDRFFVLLETSSEEAHAAAQALASLLKEKEPGPAFEAFAIAHRQEKRTAHQIGVMVVKTLITSMDREDIVAMANALYRIPRMAERFAERYAVAAPLLAGADFSRQMALVTAATQQVVTIVKELRRGIRLERIEAENARLQKIEGDADKLMLALLGDLYAQKQPPLRVVAIKDLYEALEKIIDRCRDAGNVATQIVLKHS